MKIKKLVIPPLAILIVLSMFAALPNAFAPPAGACYYLWSSKGSWNGATNRHEITYPATPNPIGQTFDVELRVANVSWLRLIGATLQWNASVLSCALADFAWGNFFDPAVLRFPPTFTSGKAGGLGWTYNVGDGYKNVTGAAHGWIATYTFHVIGAGETLIEFKPLAESVMKDKNSVVIAHSSYPCNVKVEQPLPSSPIAWFVWTPLLPEESETITFDARGSTDGYNGSQPCPITDWYWDWDDGSLIEHTLIAYPVTHAYPTAGTYSVNLTVYAPDTGTYYPYDWVVRDVTVKAPSMGRFIDVYTDEHRHPGYTTPYIGEGLYEDADAYAPQDMVILYADVKYNNWPIQNKPVIFAVAGPINPYYNVTVERLAFTNSTGTATTSFRIDWPCEHSYDVVHGTWHVLAKVDIAETWVNDTLNFECEWIIELKPGSLEFDKTLAEGYNHCENVEITFNVTSSGWIDRNVFFTIVLYDELGVPFAEYVFYQTIHPGQTVVNTISMHVPKWAYVGTATAYINAFSNDPWLCGVPYGPELSGIFVINAA
jgi:hypothetical protein